MGKTNAGMSRRMNIYQYTTKGQPFRQGHASKGLGTAAILRPNL